MSAPITALSELDAVNEMLSMLGEAPIATLEENEVIDASNAQRILKTQTLLLQNKGWSWNTDEAFLLEPSVTGELVLPRNALKVDTVGDDIGLDLVVRDHRLYDRQGHTFDIGRAVYVDMVIGLPFDEMPSTARSYVAIKAARIFQDRYVGDNDLHVYSAEDEKDAKAAFLDEEIDQVDANMIRDSQSAQRILNRSY